MISQVTPQITRPIKVKVPHDWHRVCNDHSASSKGKIFKLKT